MEFLAEYGLFLLKAITIVVAIAIVIALAVGASMKGKMEKGGSITVTKINERFKEMHSAIKEAIYDDKQLKKELKEEKKIQKKSSKDSSPPGKRVYLLDFEGDIKASAASQLRECITAILLSAKTEDEVVIRLESAGGMVHSYGLAASQLDRIRKSNIPLTVCVDKVAASGGYMMACVANKICAAPFSILGSIGVVAQLPNFNRLLKKNDIDFEVHTAGEYKRTLTMFGENTDKGREKFTEDLENTHQLFKAFVNKQRPQVDIDKVATGEIWFGTEAKDEELVDQICTSDDYISELASQHDVYLVEYKAKKSLPEKMGINLQAAIEAALIRLLSQLDVSRFLR